MSELFNSAANSLASRRRGTTSFAQAFFDLANWRTNAGSLAEPKRSRTMARMTSYSPPCGIPRFGIMRLHLQ